MDISSEQFESRIARARRAAIRSQRLVITADTDLEAHSRWLDKHRSAWSESIERIQRSIRLQAGIGASARTVVGDGRTRRWHWLAPSFGFLLLLIAVDAVSAPPSHVPAASEEKNPKRFTAISARMTTAPQKMQRSNRGPSIASGFRIINTPPLASDYVAMPPQTIALMIQIARPVAVTSEERTAAARLSKAATPKPGPKPRRLVRTKPTQPLPWLH